MGASGSGLSGSVGGVGVAGSVGSSVGGSIEGSGLAGGVVVAGGGLASELGLAGLVTGGWTEFVVLGPGLGGFLTSTGVSFGGLRRSGLAVAGTLLVA